MLAIPKPFFLFVMAFVAVAGALLTNGPEAARANHGITVTITIISVNQIGNGDESNSDLYVAADIGAMGHDDGNSFETHKDDEDFVQPGVTPGVPVWTISRTLNIANDTPPQTTTFTLEVWDHDDCDEPFCTNTGFGASDDDIMDVNPGAGRGATFTLDLESGLYTGPVDSPATCVTGDTDHQATICFTVAVTGNEDTDGDFLNDGWETNGFDSDGDTTVDVNLAAMGANPGRRDIFVEIDCLRDNTNATAALQHTHCPTQPALQQVVQAFANAPTVNSDGSQGIQLHLDVGGLYGQAPGAATQVLRTGAPAGSTTGTIGNYGGGGDRISEAGNLVVDWDGATGTAGSNFYTIKGANFNINRRYIFHYNLWVHQVNARAATNDCTSGWAEGGADSAGVLQPGNDIIISLGGTNSTGGLCWTGDANGNSVGSQGEQAGTFMHELGHNLSLDHGGGDTTNNKPNHLSVMNYTFQPCTVTSLGPTLPGGCDYSRDDLPDLNEANPPGLDECQGLDGGLYGIGPQNWDGDLSGGLPNLEGATCSPVNGGNYGRDLNGDYNDTNNNGTQDLPGEPTIISTLTGFDDWAGIRYDFRKRPQSFADGIVPPFKNEATPELLAAARAAFAELIEPELVVENAGPTDASPGDLLTYNIKTTNLGKGPAFGVGMVDTQP
ncbi:hypothetical protein AYO38_08255, partial [bacterium SCGC AG-212-C10]